jgi:hypothetical protein
MQKIESIEITITKIYRTGTNTTLTKVNSATVKRNEQKELTCSTNFVNFDVLNLAKDILIEEENK